MRIGILCGIGVLALAFTTTACDGTAGPSGTDSVGQGTAALQDGLKGAPEPTPRIHLRRDAGKPGGGSALMTWHNGDVLATPATYAIWWGPEWADPTNASFGGSDKITGMESFFGGYSSSIYAAASTEYHGLNGDYAGDVVPFGGSIYDASAAPTKAPRVSAAVAEVCTVTGNNPDPNGVYFLYTSTGAGHVNYCAWHSYGSCSNGAPVQVAYMPDIDGISGCDPQDTYGTGHSEGLAALANVTAHELSETITDPRNGGWYDSAGQENGDKCAWAFNGPVSLANGSTWKLQGEWSNAAYTAGTGFPNTSGQKGCLPN